MNLEFPLSDTLSHLHIFAIQPTTGRKLRDKDKKSEMREGYRMVIIRLHLVQNTKWYWAIGSRVYDTEFKKKKMINCPKKNPYM